jgi:hypothetical protein
VTFTDLPDVRETAGARVTVVFERYTAGKLTLPGSGDQRIEID